MAYPKCDACGIDIYPVIKRVFGGCCTDCRDRIDNNKKIKEEEAKKNVQKRIIDNQTT